MYTEKRVLHDNGCHDKDWISDNLQYEVITGSHAYGCQTPESDYDIYGMTIPPKNYLFPELYGYVREFSSNIPKFEQFAVDHIVLPNGYPADISIYGIIKYFRLVADNNPNMVDTLFVRDQLVTHKTKIAQMIRDNRSLFISKKCWHTFKGYAFSQMHKIKTKVPEGKRVVMVNKYGYDVKFAAHVIRLIDEVDQLLTSGEMDLMRANELMKSVRHGEWKLDKVEKWFEDKQPALERLYETSPLPHKVDEEKLRILLLNCLEEFYGDLKIEKGQSTDKLIAEIDKVLNMYR